MEAEDVEWVLVLFICHGPQVCFPTTLNSALGWQGASSVEDSEQTQNGTRSVAGKNRHL